MRVCDCTLSHGLKCPYFLLSFPLNSCAHNDSRGKKSGEKMAGHAGMSRAVLWEMDRARLGLPQGPIRRCQSTSAYISRCDCCISQTTGGTALDFFFLSFLHWVMQCKVKCSASKRTVMSDALYVPWCSRHEMNCFYTFHILLFDLCSQSVVRWRCISCVVFERCLRCCFNRGSGRARRGRKRRSRERESGSALGFWERADLRESRGIRERPC